MTPRLPTSTLFPYTTLFRSIDARIPELGFLREKFHAHFLQCRIGDFLQRFIKGMMGLLVRIDRKSTRLNSSHRCTSYAVFCLKKKTAYCDRLNFELIDVHYG